MGRIHRESVWEDDLDARQIAVCLPGGFEEDHPRPKRGRFGGKSNICKESSLEIDSIVLVVISQHAAKRGNNAKGVSTEWFITNR